MRIHPLALASFLAICAVAPKATALLINDESATVNSRFTSGYPGLPVANTSADFVAAGYDLSGVGWGSDATRSYVMISDRYFLYASHYPPADSNLYFYSPATAGVVHYTIDSTYAVTLEYPFSAPGVHINSDLSLGRLTTQVNPSDSITSYPILALPAFSDYVGLNLLVYGWSAKVGTGTIEALGGDSLYGHTDASGPVNDTFLMSYTRGAGSGQALLQGGDSGSPTFVPLNGRLALVGTHSAVDVGGQTSYDTFVPAYLGSLSGLGTGLSTVPEPSSLWLLGGVAFATLATRRRRFSPGGVEAALSA